MYSIGELAKISNTTIRTLRYYDEIDMLKPSRISDGGHRYYDEGAVTKLYYILSLKQIGFELKKYPIYKNKTNCFRSFFRPCKDNFL